MNKTPACAGLVAEMFPEPDSPTYEEDVLKAKAVCATCDVIKTCRENNLHEKFGVWFGTSEEDRRRERRRIRARRHV